MLNDTGQAQEGSAEGGTTLASPLAPAGAWVGPTAKTVPDKSANSAAIGTWRGLSTMVRLRRSLRRPNRLKALAPSWRLGLRLLGLTERAPPCVAPSTRSPYRGRLPSGVPRAHRGEGQYRPWAAKEIVPLNSFPSTPTQRGHRGRGPTKAQGGRAGEPLSAKRHRPRGLPPGPPTVAPQCTNVPGWRSPR